MFKTVPLFAGSGDFEDFLPVPASGQIRLFTTNDETTLEYDDTITLTYNPTFLTFVEDLQNSNGEFIRDTATIVIVDNDREGLLI